MTETVHVNPLTGEILTTEEEVRAALKIVDDQLTAIHARRRILMDALTELADEPLAMPRPRFRTETQQRAILCPRCKTRYNPKGEVAA